VPGGHETEPASRMPQNTGRTTAWSAVREISAHRRNRHLTRHDIGMSAEATKVELRGLESLTL
jgi:hypothetical protein